MRILICDDDESIIRVLSVNLTARGHEVDTATSAQQAKAIFTQRLVEGASYDLILLDIFMPGATGFAVAGYVRGAGYTGRLAFLTAGGEETANFADVDAEYWPKPTAMTHIAERIEGLPIPREET